MSDSCFVCGDNRGHILDEHHAVPRRYGGSDADENLVTVCATCHRSIENIYDDKFYERLGVSKDNANSNEIDSIQDLTKGEIYVTKEPTDTRKILKYRFRNIKDDDDDVTKRVFDNIVVKQNAYQRNYTLAYPEDFISRLIDDCKVKKASWSGDWREVTQEYVDNGNVILMPEFDPWQEG